MGHRACTVTHSDMDVWSAFILIFLLRILAPCSIYLVFKVKKRYFLSLSPVSFATVVIVVNVIAGIAMIGYSVLPCDYTECYNGGICTNTADGWYQCNCTEQFTGQQCRIKPAQNETQALHALLDW